MDVVLRLLGLARIVIGLREGVEGLEIFDVCSHKLGGRFLCKGVEQVRDASLQ